MPHYIEWYYQNRRATKEAQRVWGAFQKVAPLPPRDFIDVPVGVVSKSAIGLIGTMVAFWV